MSDPNALDSRFDDGDRERLLLPMIAPFAWFAVLANVLMVLLIVGKILGLGLDHPTKQASTWKQCSLRGIL